MTDVLELNCLVTLLVVLVFNSKTLNLQITVPFLTLIVLLPMVYS